MTTSEYISNYLIENNLSIREFAKKCGLSHSIAALYVSGVNPKTGKKVTPTLPNLQKIAYGMNVSTDALIDACDDIMIDISIQKRLTDNPKIQKLIEEIADFCDRELDDLIAYTGLVRSRR